MGYTGRQVTRRDIASVFHSWSAQGSLAPLPIAGGEGAWVWDHDGRRYLDFSSQLVNVNLGHQHPRVIEAIREHVVPPAIIGADDAARGVAAIDAVLARL